MVVLLGEDAAEEGEEDEEDVEGVPAFVEGSGMEEVGGEGEKRRECEEE